MRVRRYRRRRVGNGRRQGFRPGNASRLPVDQRHPRRRLPRRRVQVLFEKILIKSAVVVDVVAPRIAAGIEVETFVAATIVGDVVMAGGAEMRRQGDAPRSRNKNGKTSDNEK